MKTRDLNFRVLTLFTLHITVLTRWSNKRVDCEENVIWIKKCEGKKIAAVNQVLAVNQVYISFKNVDKTGNFTEKDFVNDQILDK